MVEARMQGQGIVGLSGIYERLWKRVPVHHLDPNWFFQSEGFALISSGRKQKLKRLMDLLLAFAFLFLLWPVMLLTALAVRLESRGAAMYRQVRTGKGGEPFTILKFRSMRIDAEKDGAQWAKTKDDRITRIGGFIRKTRLDELPQLFNVLAGQMSFIGPRPERPEFNDDLAKKIPYYNLRHMVRPGLTGWAQISYPYGASVEDAHRKLEYDLYYIKNQNLIFDVKILLKTARVVLLAAGR
jgi:exopolysaccharide biosynthesis polyprenyl glycosylphosphotransferase